MSFSEASVGLYSYAKMSPYTLVKSSRSTFTSFSFSSIFLIFFLFQVSDGVAWHSVLTCNRNNLSSNVPHSNFAVGATSLFSSDHTIKIQSREHMHKVGLIPPRIVGCILQSTILPKNNPVLRVKNWISMTEIDLQLR